MARKNGFGKRNGQRTLHKLALDMAEAGLYRMLEEGLWKLSFASPSLVIALILKQLSFGLLSRSRLGEHLGDLPPGRNGLKEKLLPVVREACRLAVVMEYVRDCEHVAQYLDAGAGPETREKIRGCFLLRYYNEWISRIVMPVFTSAFGRAEAENCSAGYLELIESHVFAPSSFMKIAEDYSPAEGKTFSSFLKQKILWQCLSIVRSNPGTITVELPDTLFEPAEEPRKDETYGDNHEKFLRLLIRCLERLCIPGNDDAGGRRKRRRMVFELRHSAYIPPDLLMHDTKKLIQSSPANKRDPHHDYYGAGPLLRDIQDAEREQESKSALAYAHLQECEAALYRAGYPFPAIDRLEREAVHGKIGKLRRELDRVRAKSSGRNPGRDVEISYMLAFHTYHSVRKALEDIRNSLADYDRVRGKWLRSQTEIASMLGLSQAAVSRDLEEARDKLAGCGGDAAETAGW